MEEEGGEEETGDQEQVGQKKRERENLQVKPGNMWLTADHHELSICQTWIWSHYCQFLVLEP